METTCKIAIIGPAHQGKTAYIRALMGKNYKKHLQPTMGGRVHIRRFKYSDSQKVYKLLLWEVGGRYVEKTSDLKRHVHDSQGILFFCNPDHPDYQWWKTQIAKMRQKGYIGQDVRVIQVTSKSDRPDVPNYHRYCRVSAKTGDNIWEPISAITARM